MAASWESPRSVASQTRATSRRPDAPSECYLMLFQVEARGDEE
jgi:hypothetical protein